MRTITQIITGPHLVFTFMIECIQFWSGYQDAIPNTSPIKSAYRNAKRVQEDFSITFELFVWTAVFLFMQWVY